MLVARFPARIVGGRAIRSSGAGRERLLPCGAKAPASTWSTRDTIVEIPALPPDARIFCFSRLPPRALGGGVGASAMAWACPQCTYLNQGVGAACGMCSLDSPEAGVDSGPEWSCPTCTFLNPFVESSCEMCSTARPELTELERTNSSGRADRPATKFRALRACPRNSAEKSPEALGFNAENRTVDDLHLSGDRDAISRKRKAAAVVDDEDGLNANEMDGHTTRSAAGEGEVSNNNRWLGQLHMQRMSRINNGMASSDVEKKSQQSSGQASGLASNSSEPRRLATAGGPCPNLDSDIVVILTYNVWFNEDLELQARMNAIGKTIQLRQPHVICFQLSRLPVSSFHRNPYSNSIMGREVAMADLDHGSGGQLVVATTHLESPCPAPPTWNQMFSKERVAQAKEALKLMKDLPNVVFGGDMNWDDKLDGPPPLPPGWFDAWIKHQPTKRSPRWRPSLATAPSFLTCADCKVALMCKQPGLTYDSKANPMLTGSRLQKRLDRFFCHLQDFKVKSIEMVGTEPILGLTYEKERKVKGKVQCTTLPVLPSDHFGLLLQLQRVPS